MIPSNKELLPEYNQELQLLQFHKKPSTGLNGFSFILDNMQVKIFCATNIEMRFGAIKHHLINVTGKSALGEDSWMK